MDKELFIEYLPVDVQKHVFNRVVLLDERQSFLRTQTRNLLTVVAAQQNTEVNELQDSCRIKALL